MDNKGSCDFYPYRSFSNRHFFLFTLIFVNNPFLLKLELMFFVCCTHLNKVKKVSVIIRDSVWVPLIFFLELHLLYRLILWMFGMLLPQDSVSSQVFFFLSTFINSIQVLLPYMSSKHWTIDGSSDPRQTCCDIPPNLEHIGSFLDAQLEQRDTNRPAKLHLVRLHSGNMMNEWWAHLDWHSWSLGLKVRPFRVVLTWSPWACAGFFPHPQNLPC